MITFIIYEFLFAYLIFPFVQNRYYSSSYYLIFLLPLFIISFSFLLLQIYLKNKLMVICFISFFVFLNCRTYLTFQMEPNFKTKMDALTKIILQNRRKEKLIIYSSIASEKYSFLLYRACQKVNYDYNKIRLFEPWNKPQNYDLIINQKTFL